MKRVREMDRFVADPLGHYYLGPTYLVWCVSPTLCGSAHWGRSTVRDAHALTRLFDFTRHPVFRGGHDVLMDSGAIESIDWSAFTVLTDYVKSRLREWGERIRRQAVVVPSGPVGLILSGLVPLLGMTYAMRFFSARGDALAWLDRDDARAAAEAVEPLVDEARGTSPLLRALRDHLERSLHHAAVDTAARALGVAPRSLQRELRKSGTGFSAELLRARVRVASVLLAHSDEKIEVISRRVGCSSSSRLSALFRRAAGETPARFRARHRQA